MSDVKPRVQFLDTISGVMIIHMVVGHALQFGGIHATGTWYDNYVSLALFFFMPWFYFKTGLFISRRSEVRNFVTKDVRRLIVPYVVFTIIGSAILLSFMFIEGEQDWFHILRSPIIGVIKSGSAGGNLVLWFLLSLFFCRLVYRVTPERWLPLLLVVALASGTALNYYEVKVPFAIHTVFPGVVFLLLGYYRRPYVLGEKLTKLNRGQIVIVLLYVTLLLSFHPHGGLRGNNMGSPYVLWMAGAWVACLAAVVLFRTLPVCKPLAYVGRESMVFYVVHWLPLVLTKNIVLMVYPDISNNALTATLLVATAAFLALVSWQHCLHSLWLWKIK